MAGADSGRARWWRRRPGRRGRRIVDATLAVILGGYAVAEALGGGAYRGSAPLAAVLLGMAAACLAFRRIRPRAAFAGCLGLLTTAALLVGPFQTGGSILIAVVAAYSGMAYGVGWGLFTAMTVLFAVVDNRGPLPEALAGVAFVCVLVGLVGYGGWLTRRLREVSAANEALRRLVEMESETLAQAAVEEERARVAREIHDILAHSLGVIVLQAGAAEHAWEADPIRARSAVEAARSTALEAIDQMRTLLAAVRDAEDGDRAPLPTLDDLLALARSTTEAGFTVDLTMSGNPRPVSALVQASVYRVMQEGIANAMRHSGAGRCAVELSYEPDRVVIRIDDEGGASGGEAGSQWGLAGIRERAAILGGGLEAGPLTSGGWRLAVEFPA